MKRHTLILSALLMLGTSSAHAITTEALIDSVQYASFSPDGRYLVTASNDHTARVWEVATGEAVTPSLRHNFLVTSAFFSPDGHRVVTASGDGTARVWEIVGRGETALNFRHDSGAWCVAFSSDANFRRAE